MSSFRTPVTPNRRAGNRFISAVRRTLQKAFADEAQKRGLTQAEIARLRGINRSVVNRELRGVENLTLRSVAELAWGMGRTAELVLAEPAERPGQNTVVSSQQSISTTETTSNESPKAMAKVD